MADDDRGDPDVFVTDVLAASVTADEPRFLDSPVGKLALVRDGETLLAIDAWCPHLDGPLWEGSTAKGQIACPWHGWRFSLRTGECVWAPAGDAEEAAETQLRVLATRTGPRGFVEIVLPPE